jgi:hypothetical protein
MAELARPVLPEFLYRYRSIPSFAALERELAAITQRRLWFSRYEILNDPMEGFYQPSKGAAKRNDFEEMADLILRWKANIGICCLSDTKDNELMWTHYAGNYTGICVGYRTQLLLEGLSSEVRLVRLAYDGSPPEISRTDIRDPPATAIKILSHKKSNWIYEREWRLLHSPTPPRPKTEEGWPLTIGARDCVSEVYLGSRIPEVVKLAIKKNLIGRPIRIFQMDVIDYEHTWETLQGSKFRSARTEPASAPATNPRSTKPSRRRTTARTPATRLTKAGAARARPS